MASPAEKEVNTDDVMMDESSPAAPGDEHIRNLADASPAYRGYRLQALYTLSRILKPNPRTLSFQPEGVEDLAIFADERLVEAIQIKSLASNLTLSDLVSSSHPESSFFHRMVTRIREQPDLRVTLISFGPVGREIEQASAGDENARTKISRKFVERHGIPPTDSASVLEALVVECVDENELIQDIFDILRNAVTGTDPKSAFELLSHWLYGRAERKSLLTQQNVIERVNGVGRFTAERAACADVWFSSVEPIENQPIGPHLRGILAAEYYRGVNARYEHVMADLDVPRPFKLKQIAKAMDERHVVVLHAASGQGKSTLAYRYMRQELPDAQRYSIRSVQDRTHADKIALALEGWANAIEEPIVVFVDVSPRDVGWSDLVERLALHRRIRVLVAIREEDWRLASFVDTDVFREVELDFDRTDAEELYSSLSEFRVPLLFLDFEEAWERFGGTGQLLEFVYLVTQGGLLRERLTNQISALKRAANKGERGKAELDLLRLVAVASAFNGRLRVTSLSDHLQLPAIDEAINLLENEYLVRRSAGRTLIEGLHPIRSDILVELLTDPEIVKWSDVLVRSLRLLDERDLGSVLLHCFSRRRDEVTPVLGALASFQPLSWAGIMGGIRALLWLGLREYADANVELISDAKRDSGPGWSVVLDGDIAGVMSESAESPFDRLGDLVTEERRHQMETLRNRQTPKSYAFTRVTSWLQRRMLAPDVPSSTEDWSAAAESVFWIGRLTAGWPIEEWLPPESVTRATSKLPLDVAADLVVGLAEGYGEAFPRWLDAIRPTLRDRFQRELRTPVLEDNQGRLTAHFVVDPGLSLEPDRSVLIPTLDAKNPLHNEALVHVDMMRRLFPDRESYACQGHGHGAGLLQLPNDDTRKTGIPRYRLPLRWQTSINATFGGIVDFDTRPTNWLEYANRVSALREDVVRCLGDLREALPIYLRSSRPVAVHVPGDEWYRCWTILRDPPRLPQCAVDEWGFVYEA